ncbi:MAG: 3-phosphoshikimate 1-carboxyvinyltransferase [Longimicrobiaceae bacterium]
MRLRVFGDISVPGDKSITHRALMLAAAAEGTSRLRGLLAAEDCESTAGVLRALGCDVPALPPSGAEILVPGRGLRAWRQPEVQLDCGNSGTTARLMLGLLAGRPFAATLTGDDSLRRRPMRRVIQPLREMGATISEVGGGDHLPVEIRGGALRDFRFRSPTASAQVKSALLLAGLSGGATVSVIEPTRSRDHTERMLRGLGITLSEGEREAGWEVSLQPAEKPLPPLDLDVPGDLSSAAFFVALALLADAGELRIRRVGVNPTRTGFLGTVSRMGGFVELHDERTEGGEPVADLIIRPARLRGVEVGGNVIPTMLDELPVLAILAARAEGETVIRDAGELRVKESDRIAALAENLRAIGVDAEELADGLVVRGTDRRLAGRVKTHGDHRIAMAFGVLGALPGSDIQIDEPAVIGISFPGFWELLDSTTAMAPEGSTMARRTHRDDFIVAIDGPAGSGKSSTARGVAADLGYRHLDSGAFYRALTLAALRAGIPTEQWDALTEADLQELGVAAVRARDGYNLTVNGRDVTSEMRSAEVNAHVSRMAALPAVRSWLLVALRRAGQGGRLVADGRDIGTVVFPDADLKVFLVCAPEERALRRLREQGVTAPSRSELQAEAERLLGRDALDSTREVAPLLRAPDAVLLDTTALPFDAQVRAIVRMARARIGG